ncbi:S8 family serine peptidase [Kordia sp. YSTF-M3]|uniref:S8 family serine peptidase n=1 Tax=Kordia aestuariivivens TaxID=2759037 RepID=A0ABR7Q9N3_9FLAO|nr:S8 family serine peptidase [Kordia aestuariivivens]MBC8755253.1 S8 family serine peptidase [Kordia aestuariivivens]
MKSLKPFLITVLSCCCIIACTSLKSTTTKPTIVTAAFAKKQALTETEKQNWHFKDIYEDSIPGVSLDKAYKFLKGKKGDTIIVALIDTELDIDHEDLKDQIWINKGEIPNNNIDDDNNGYVDDIHGWNFLQTTKKGPVLYANHSFIRIMKKYDLLFKDKEEKQISESQKKEFKEYLRAIKTYKKEKKEIEKDIATYNRIKNKFIEADSLLTKYFSRKDYTISQLDSLSKITNDSLTKVQIRFMKYYLKNNMNPEWADRGIKGENKKLNTWLSFTYDDRQNQRDNVDDLNDVPYGNNNVQGTLRGSHGTRVMSVLGATRNNDIGINGISNSLKVMFLGVAPLGNEHDKDIALGIRYAVDNGAQIINMSIGKEFSMHPDWLEDVIKYAEQNDVLIVSSTGNKSYNLDNEFDYPDDYNEDGEYVNNFIKVGASSFTADSTMVWLSSNYSNKNVDIFAPGHKIYSLSRRKPSFGSGTSYASPIVAGIAALIRSYYPNLSAVEVKDIIMKSGISFEIDVERPYPYGDEPYAEKIPFSSMSKSGKIANAYNALVLAEKVSKKKKNRN